ncbi:cation:proton antiporter regulatory subunit [Halorubrum sp. DTA46]|uniref:cation:proton antiporter regulatory subunit n=1 Tax=Halorubrum sp. DTA46 TaxID=3402162 RepID=UPI003AABAB2D
MPLEVRERDIPGVGMRYEIDVDDHQTVMALLHTNGRRDIYYRDSEESDEFERIFRLSDTQARTLGLFLVGAYYQPIATKFGQESSSGRYVDWYTVDSGSPLDGVERRTVSFTEEYGVTLLAVERDDTVHSTVGDAFTFAAGDSLIVLGTDGQHNDFATFVYDG